MTNVTNHRPPQVHQKNSVNFNVAPDFLSIMLDFLIDQKIPFHLYFDGIEPAKEETYPKEMSENKEGQINILTSYQQNKVEMLKDSPKEKWPHIMVVYKKYIGDGSLIAPPIKHIAQEFGLSIDTLKNQFKKVYGDSFHKVYMTKRMNFAAKLLSEGSTASAAAKRIGYTHPIKFNKQFQKFFGTTPYQYKKYHMNNFK